MLYAEIRTPRDAFHFFGEVSGYNMQTLQQHVRQSMREEGGLRLRLEIQPEDRSAFKRYTTRWLARLENAGVPVQVTVVQPRRPAPAPLLSLTLDGLGPGVQERRGSAGNAKALTFHRPAA
jgi:hypothetical protein